jgi:hypothetical protein
MDTERLVRQHVRNWFCGLTRAECESELSDALDVGHTMKAKALRLSAHAVLKNRYWSIYKP